MQGDTPIKRKTFLEMSDTEQYAFIEALRERRMAPIALYEEIREAAKQKKISKLQQQLDKQIQMFEKCLAQCNKKLDELQDRANKLRGIKIQLDLE